MESLEKLDLEALDSEKSGLENIDLAAGDMVKESMFKDAEAPVQNEDVDQAEIDQQVWFVDPRAKKQLLAGFIIIVVLGALCGPPLLATQKIGEQRVRSLSNMRHLADSWQLYAQDWDSLPVPSVEHRHDGTWLTWPRRLNAYGALPSVLSNPANSVFDSSNSTAPGPYPPNPANDFHDPKHGFVVATSYALNHRFWNTFARGPFSPDNLELPAQTALFVEAGPMSLSPLHPPLNTAESKGLALLEYGDTLDRVGALIPYPSTHDGRLAVVAADGHAMALHVEHYTHKEGPHNSLYGRIGGDIYNWNGGHPNGEVDRPPRE